MNKEQSVLLELIKKSQFGSSEQICWDEVDMQTLYDEASSQALAGLIAPEIPDDRTANAFVEANLQQIANYVRYCNAEDQLNSLMKSASISFVVLKGNAAAISYKTPSLRKMGDIDFLVPQERFDETKELLSSSGFVFDHTTDRHVSYRKSGVTFELHHHFSHDDLDIEDYLIDGLKHKVIKSIDGHEFPMLPMSVNGLVLLEHLMEHFKSAIGLRQVIDWMMYVYRNLDDEFWNQEFKSVAEDKGLATFAITVTRMCQLYLGLPETITWCKSADVKVCEQLIECILTSGNFGRKNAQGNSVETVSTSIKRKGLFRWLQTAGEYNWKAYHKHHWLKPLCWFYQIFRYAKQGIRSGRNKKQIKEDLDRSKERYELLKKLGIE